MAPDWNGNTGRVRVLLDANALMMPAQFGVDIFGETELLIGAYEPVILEDVMYELEGISNGHGRAAAAARVALSLCEKCTIEASRHRDLPVDEVFKTGTVSLNPISMNILFLNRSTSLSL